MILRPLDPASPVSQEFLPAWNMVEPLQRQSLTSCWMITQPSHAALAGEIASKMAGPQVPKLDAELIRAIALHDAGWGVPDAQAIVQSRSVGQGRPKSFIECGVIELLDAWEKSIDIAASVGPAGGYIVSRHFWRLGQHRVQHTNDHDSDRKKISRFLESETRRQKQLATKQKHGPGELELFTDVLQFCDLLSLYVCSGARQNAEFPEFFGVNARLTLEPNGFSLDPPIVHAEAPFLVAALRHPPVKDQSSMALEIGIW